jgi:hypothetical protein
MTGGLRCRGARCTSRSLTPCRPAIHVTPIQRFGRSRRSWPSRYQPSTQPRQTMLSNHRSVVNQRITTTARRQRPEAAATDTRPTPQRTRPDRRKWSPAVGLLAASRQLGSVQLTFSAPGAGAVAFPSGPRSSATRHRPHPGRQPRQGPPQLVLPLHRRVGVALVRAVRRLPGDVCAVRTRLPRRAATNCQNRCSSWSASAIRRHPALPLVAGTPPTPGGAHWVGPSARAKVETRRSLFGSAWKDTREDSRRPGLPSQHSALRYG